MLNHLKHKKKRNLDRILLDATVQKHALRILHVDDNALFLNVSKKILEIENNFEIDTATSVYEAFNKMRAKKYDAIISDYEMPLKDGLNFLKELREEKNNIAFIFFSFTDREEVAFKAMKMGADHSINKGGSPETVYPELANAIRKIVERKKTKSMLVEREAKYSVLATESLQMNK